MAAVRERWQRLKERFRHGIAAIDDRLPRRLSGLIHRFTDREILLTASSLAFYGLVSALPLLLLTFAAVEAIAGDQALQRFADHVASTGPEGAGRFVEQLVQDGGSFTWATVLFTAWPATAYGGGLRRALLKYTRQEGSLPGLRGRLLGLSLVLTLPTLTLAGIPLMFVLTSFAGEGLLPTLLGWTLALAAGIVLGTAITTLLYRAFTPKELGWAETLQGAALTAAVTTLFTLGFVVYLNVGNTQERFGGGTIALVVLLGVWLFVANILLLAGYQVVSGLQRHDD